MMEIQNMSHIHSKVIQRVVETTLMPRYLIFQTQNTFFPIHLVNNGTNSLCVRSSKKLKQQSII